MNPRQAPSPHSAASDGAPLDQPALLAALRSRVARLERTGQARTSCDTIPVCEGLEVPGGGLAGAALHEVLAAAPGCGTAFCALLLGRTAGTVLWIASGADDLLAWPPGLARMGLAPERLVLVRAARWADALWAMEEALRCPAVTGALLSPGWEASAVQAGLDLTATRRLQLAAEAGGALGLLLRADGERLRREHSAAVTRWRISPLPTFGGEQDMDASRWELELLRTRGGVPGGPWAVTWHGNDGLTLDEGACATPRHQQGLRR